MIRGSPPDRVRAVARASDLGINYFDTAPMYGNGQSETNLGSALRETKSHAYIGTKVFLSESETDGAKKAIVGSLKSSLRRLRRNHVDIFYLHNPIARQRDLSTGTLSVEDVLGSVAETFGELKREGLTRFAGFTAVGETEALHEVIGSRKFDVAQMVLNLLNPSAGHSVSRRFYAQDYRGLIDKAVVAGMGVVAIRVLAGGALSQTEMRHPIATSSVEPMGSGSTYEEDVLRSKAFEFLVREGHAKNLPEAAIRFAMSKKEVSTILVGYSDIGQLEESVSSASMGPLAPKTLERLKTVWKEFGGDSH